MKLFLIFFLLVSCLRADVTQYVTIGSKWKLTANFTKPATNPPDTIYKIQWTRNNSGISGATAAEYFLTINSSADLGTYQFHVTAYHPSNPTSAERVNSDKGFISFQIKPAENLKVGAEEITLPAPTP
jgi:hypothetical protein